MALIIGGHFLLSPAGMLGSQPSPPPAYVGHKLFRLRQWGCMEMGGGVFLKIRSPHCWLFKIKCNLIAWNSVSNRIRLSHEYNYKNKFGRILNKSTWSLFKRPMFCPFSDLYFYLGLEQPHLVIYSKHSILSFCLQPAAKMLSFPFLLKHFVVLSTFGRGSGH